MARAVTCTASGKVRSWGPGEWISGKGTCPDCGAAVDVWVRGSDLSPMAKARAHKAPPGVSPAPNRVRDNLIDLYHRTTAEAAAAILAEGRMTSRENTGEVYFSTVPDGHATGYGDAVVQVRVPAAMAELDDEFPDGERHYRIKASELGFYHFVKTESERNHS